MICRHLFEVLMASENPALGYQAGENPNVECQIDDDRIIDLRIDKKKQKQFEEIKSDCHTQTGNNHESTIALDFSQIKTNFKPNVDTDKLLNSSMVLTNYQEKSKNRRHSRRNRTMFSERQLGELEWRFNRNKYLITSDRIRLAKLLNLNQLQVKTWFQVSQGDK